MGAHFESVQLIEPAIRVRILREGASAPAYKSEGAAGMDLAALLDAPIVLEPSTVVRVPTGIAVALPRGYEGQVRPRSGLAFTHAVTVVNSPGTIDWDYRGEIVVGLINLGREAFTVENGMRVAQLVVAPVTRASIERVEELDQTDRGEGGFGSTGMRA